MKYWISHFSGCGGSTLGAMDVGFTPILGIENNLEIAELYRNNIKSHVIWDDIGNIEKPQILFVPTELDRKRNGDILVIQSSPPCQEFSNANTKKDATSHRANVLLETIWHYEYLRPEYIIIENVAAFAKSIPYLQFENVIEGMGYLVDKQVLDASSYGVPQSRKRFFAVFSKLGHQRFSFNIIKKSRSGGWLESVSSLVDSLEFTTLTENQKRVLKDIPSNQVSIIERVGYYNKTPKVRLSHEPIWTLRSHLANDGKSSISTGQGRQDIIDIQIGSVEYGTTKKVDTRVLARLQSFPDRYKWSNSFKLNVHAIGNSIPPLLMRKICEQLS